jgi:iduronate 2-sulfatase
MPRVALFVLIVVVGLVRLQANQPNVLLICVDDLKPAIGCFGDQHAVTPNLDQLATEGVRFDAAYCNQAVCSPSRNALMTGLRPQTIGIYDLGTHFRLAVPDAITFSQYFIQHGYHAEGLGKIFHTGHGNIDDQASWSVPSWRASAETYALPANVAAIKPDAKGKKRGPATEAADVPDDTYDDGRVADEAIKRLQQAAAKPEQPFFLAVGFVKPHLPFVAPQKYWDLYEPAKLPMPTVETAPVDAPSYAPTSGGELRNYTNMPKGEIDEVTTRHLIHGYYAATSFTDAQIGKVLGTLDRLDLTKNTIIVLWGDHGWHLGDHGMWCKHTNYEQATRIPVIISAPGGARNAGTSALIETVDIYPTVAELAGIEVPEQIDGISFAATVRDPKVQARTHVTHVYPRDAKLGRAIRNERYRMVEWNEIGAAAEESEIELYDYQSDPLETRNVAEMNPEVVSAMRAELAKQTAPQPQWKAAAKQKPSTAETAPTKTKPDRGTMFKKRDTDKDGFLSKDEFLLNQPEAAKRFPKLDLDGDGKLSAAEFIGD